MMKRLLLPTVFVTVAVGLTQLTVSGQATFPGPRAVPTPYSPPADVPAPAAPDVSPMAQPKPKPDGRITVNLTDGSCLIGRPKELSTIKFKAKFGEVAVPLKSISGVRRAGTDESPIASVGRVTLAFKNGDMLSGELQLSEIELESKWGKTTVAMEYVASIITSVGDKVWVHHDRWRLVPKANCVAPNGLPLYPVQGFTPSTIAPAGGYSTPIAAPPRVAY